MNLSYKCLLLVAFLLLGLALPASAQSAFNLGNDDHVKPTPSQQFFYWFPNRILDFADIFRFGLAFGPGWGGEVAVTDKYQLGNYKANQTGFGWYGSAGDRKLVSHSGKYKTKVTGADDTRLQSPNDSTRHFFRGRRDEQSWDVRGQFALGLVQPYFGIDVYEIGDFFTGLTLVDLRKDDMSPLGYVDTDPPRKLGRGVSNLLTGITEIPKSIYAVDKSHGGVAAFTWGTAMGVKRFFIRETVGIYEILTFPAPGDMIIEPEFPFIPQQSDTSWRLRRAW